MREHAVENFKYGIIDSIESQSIPEGAASASKNWLTLGDRIVLRNGQKLVGSEVTGNGRVTGLAVTRKADGTEVLWKTYARKVLWYDTAAEDFNEIGTNTLPAAASGEDISFSEYATLAGSQTWLCSPNSGLYKIMTANPDDIVDQTNASKNFKGKIKIKQNRMMLWGRTADKSGIYGSYIDTATYTTVSAEVLGASGSTTYSGTLAFKGGGSKRTCFAVSITGTTGAGAETFTDDYNGVLTGSLGGTGTINYATGAYSVTFSGVVTSGNVTADYQWEDSTNNGIADFTKSATRTAGQGFVFRQDDGGGDAQNVLSYGDAEFCMHEFKTWRLTLTSDDTNATNLIYRDRVGIPNHRAAVATGQGIYYIDDSDTAKPKFRLLTLDSQSSEVVPIAISNNLDLADYRFDQAASIEYGDYVIFACRTKNASANDTLIFYHKIWKALDKTDISAACLTIYGGKLVVGDSITNNVYEVSGFDDDDSNIANYWDGNISELNVRGTKKVKRFIIEGELSVSQTIEVYLSYDRAAFTLVGEIDGNGSYVDLSSGSTIGSLLIGGGLIGGEETVTGYHFTREFRLRSDKFNNCKVRFVATGIGHAAISLQRYWDIQTYGQKVAAKYRASL